MSSKPKHALISLADGEALQLNHRGLPNERHLNGFDDLDAKRYQVCVGLNAPGDSVGTQPSVVARTLATLA